MRTHPEHTQRVHFLMWCWASNTQLLCKILFQLPSIAESCECHKIIILTSIDHNVQVLSKCWCLSNSGWKETKPRKVLLLHPKGKNPLWSPPEQFQLFISCLHGQHKEAESKNRVQNPQVFQSLGSKLLFQFEITLQSRAYLQITKRNDLCCQCLRDVINPDADKGTAEFLLTAPPRKSWS